MSLNLIFFWSVVFDEIWETVKNIQQCEKVLLWLNWIKNYIHIWKIQTVIFLVTFYVVMSYIIGPYFSVPIGFPIGIPLRGIARNGCFRFRYFIARNWAKIAKKEAIKYSRNCAELRASELLFYLKRSIILTVRLTNLCSRYKNGIK